MVLGLMGALMLVWFVGLTFGFVGSIPVAGPTSVIVLQSALRNGRADSLHIAAGAGLGEAMYAFAAFFGLTAALVRFPEFANAASLLGGCAIALVGLFFALPRRRTEGALEAPVKRRAASRWLLGFASTSMNPTLLFTWTAVVTALHGTAWLRVEPLDAIPFSLGVGLGIVGWFFVMVKLVEKFRERLLPESVERLIRSLGVLLILLGAASVLKVLLKR